jgi:hypothetical protein
LHEEEDDDDDDNDDDDEDTVATALSNASITESAEKKEAVRDVPQLDLAFVVRAWLCRACVCVCGRGRENRQVGSGRRREEGLSSSYIEMCASSAPPSLPPSQVDSTGSMDAYIQAAQESIHDIITRLACDDGVSVRFALVSYRDHAPQVVCV